MTTLRNALLYTLLLSGSILPSTTTYAWEFNSVLWNFEDSPIPLELHNSGVDELSVEDIERVVQNVVRTWNAVPCAWIKLSYTGTTPDVVQTDDRQILQFIEDPDRWVYGSMSAGAMIADVYDPPETPEHESPRVDIAFNGVHFNWKIGGSGDPRNIETLDPEAVLTHEVGHLLGLSHTRSTNAGTMAAAYIPDLGQSSLSFDDKAGLCAKYWRDDAPECTADANCPDTHTCLPFNHTTEDGTEGSTSLCSEPHGSFGDPCAGDQLNCIGFCRFTTNDLSEGYCSALCDPEDTSTCPDQWLCVDIGGPFQDLFVCQPDPDAPEPDAGCCDDDVDPADTSDDTSNTDTDPSNDTSNADTPPNDASTTGTTPNTTPPTQPPPTDDCDCATPHAPAPQRLPMFAGFTFILGLLIRRSRNS